MEHLTWLDATALAELVRQREVTAAEVVEAAIARVERVNPTLNAMVTPMYEQARAAASQEPAVTGPMAGVPTLIKDLSVAVAGVPLSQGSRWLRSYVPPYESVMVTRLRQAGMLLLGKSNTPEFGLLPTTEPLAFGPCRNPWDITRSAGGSSGGAAAAVAAGLVPVAMASDGGGSIRIPASCCGLFGLVPSRGRVSSAPLGDPFGLSRWHFVTRSVRDSAALLDVTSGPVPGDPYACPPPVRPFAEEVGADPGRLRIAFSVDSPLGTPVHPECAAAVEATARLCASLGHEVEPATPAIDPAYQDHFMVLWYSLCAATIDLMRPFAGRPPGDDDLEPLTREMARRGQTVTAGQYLGALAALQMMGRRLAEFLTRYDLWLTPVLAEPPAPLGSFPAESDDYDADNQRVWAYTPFTAIVNPTGLPAMSVPLGWSSDGLPLGSHFVGRFGKEATLLRLAAQLEAAQPWADRRPPVHA